MTLGLAFLLSMLIEGAAAALLGAALCKPFKLSRFGAGLRVAAAAVIGTGATHPLVWLYFSKLVEWTGTWRGAAALSEAGMVLVETLFYAAALRGHWRWSLGLSILVNSIAFGAGLLLAFWLPKPG